MPSGVIKITNVPEDDVRTVVADFELEDPISIEKIDQGENLWTVVVIFPGDGEHVRSFS